MPAVDTHSAHAAPHATPKPDATTDTITAMANDIFALVQGNPAYWALNFFEQRQAIEAAQWQLRVASQNIDNSFT